jgi:hypothetical protein
MPNSVRYAYTTSISTSPFFALDGFSTLVDEVATAHRQAGLAPRAITTRVRPLAAVLADNSVECIDFLKVDVEGAEQAVLASNDWARFRPSLVLVEAVDSVTRAATHAAWESLLLQAGYGFAHFDGVNRFYWNSRDLPLPDAACFLPPNAFDGFTPYAVIAADGRAAAASREAAYERQNAGNLLAAMLDGLQKLARHATPPAPDASLRQPWTEIAAALGEAQSLREAVKTAIATLPGHPEMHGHGGDLGKILAAAAAAASTAAEQAFAASTAAAKVAQLAQENDELRNLLKLSEQRRLALVETVPPAPEHAAAPMRDPVALEPANVAANARVFASRDDLMASFAGLRPSTVAEIGVALGDFSQAMIETLRPAKFVAFDIFNMHCFPVHWGRPSSEIFGDLTHREFYEQRISGLGKNCELVVEVGPSADQLPRYPDSAFDFIYIDGAHDYERVRTDAAQASRLASPDGVLIFNDYTLYDPVVLSPYGVVQAVNELLAAGEWVVVGFAFQRHMFCDIALRRATVSSAGTADDDRLRPDQQQSSS